MFRLTLIATSIIGYRAAGAANPADVMLPCIITRLLVLLPLFLTLESEKKLILRVL
jgi:spore maturation protein SpmA